MNDVDRMNSFFLFFDISIKLTIDASILYLKGKQRGIKEGFLGAKWGLPLLTPRKPPGNPQVTPRQLRSNDKKKSSWKTQIRNILWENLNLSVVESFLFFNSFLLLLPVNLKYLFTRNNKSQSSRNPARNLVDCVPAGTEKRCI